jgi:hypothetical protein
MAKKLSDLPVGDADEQRPDSNSQPANQSLMRTPEHPLTSQQQTAIEHLAAGKSVSESADLVGVSRRSIQLWLKSDPHFRAAYNSWRTQTTLNTQARLLAMADAAATAVGKAIEAGNTTAALAILKGMGMVTPPKIGAETPEAAQAEIEMDAEANALETRRRQIDLREKRERANFGF